MFGIPGALHHRSIAPSAIALIGISQRQSRADHPAKINRASRALVTPGQPGAMKMIPSKLPADIISAFSHPRLPSCPRCTGFLFRDHDYDTVCVSCGYRFYSDIQTGHGQEGTRNKKDELEPKAESEYREFVRPVTFSHTPNRLREIQRQLCEATHG